VQDFEIGSASAKKRSKYGIFSTKIGVKSQTKSMKLSQFSQGKLKSGFYYNFSYTIQAPVECKTNFRW
jgi:hypothetical protein